MTEQKTTAAAVQEVHGTTMFTDTGRFALAQRAATVFANSQLVPNHLRGKVADCLIALNIADRLGEDPLTVMQSIYVVSGKAGWSSSYMIARINQSGLVRGRLTWDVAGKGKELEVTAKATLADTGEVVTATATMLMAIAEGWVSNKKYSSMPEMMLRYRSAAMLQRLYFPEVMLGMRTAEELETEAPEIRDVTPKTQVSVASALAQFAQGATAEPEPAPEVVIESNEVPPDGPNVFDRGDEEAVAELEERTGIRDNSADDLADYLSQSIDAIKGMTLEELEGAAETVKATLKGHSDLLQRFAGAVLERQRELAGRRRR